MFVVLLIRLRSGERMKEPEIFAAVIVAAASVGALARKFWVSATRGAGSDSELHTIVYRISKDVDELKGAEAEFQRKGWTTLPDDISSSSGLTTVIRELQHELIENRRDHEEIKKALRDIGKTDG